MRHFVEWRGRGTEVTCMPFVYVLRLVRKARFEQIVFIDLAGEIQLDGGFPVEGMKPGLISRLLPAADHCAYWAGGEPLGC